MKKKQIQFHSCNSFFYLFPYHSTCTTLFHQLLIKFFQYLIRKRVTYIKKNEYIKALCQQKLDKREQHLLHNIFKIGQKSLSKLFMTSQLTFTCSKSARETLEVDVVLMALFLPLNIIHTIFESLLLTLNRNMFIQIASSDYETKSIYIYFFRTIKCCCQEHVQRTLLFKIISIRMFQKEAIFYHFQGMLI